MDKKVFNKITKEVFLEYGFKKDGNSFVLLLPDIIITVRFVSYRGIKYFGFNIGIHALYDSSVPYTQRYESLIELKLEHSPFLRGYYNHEIAYERYDELEYRKLLSNTLHSYFDSYKIDGLQSLRDNAHTMVLRPEAKEYLGLS